MTFITAQITDLHVSEAGTGTDEMYQTRAHLAAAVAHITNLEQTPDVVLATGDLVDYGTPAEYEGLREMFSPLAMPLHLIPGNHDDRDNLRAAFPDHGYLPAGEFLHYTLEDYPLRLVGLDTQITGQTGGTLCAERLAWLDETLTAAPERPTLVFMHHPPITSGIVLMDRNGFDNPAPTAKILSRHPQVIRVIAGHLHRPITADVGGRVLTVAPSTAHQIGLDMAEDAGLTLLMEPPAVYLHVWNKDSGLVSHTSYVGEYEVRHSKIKLGGN